MTIKILKILWICLIGLMACNSSSTGIFLGYIEGQTIEISSPIAGTLQSLSVRKGDDVKIKTPLFILEQEKEKAQKREAEERLSQAKSLLENLKKGKRPSEIAVIEAQLQSAEAALKLAKIEYQRDNALYQKNLETKRKLDETRARLEQTEANVHELQAALTTARLPARQDEISATEAEVLAAQAFLNQIEWNLEQKKVYAPTHGQVIDTYYLPGEWIPAGTPVISLLSPEYIKIRFFVPELTISTLQIGQTVSMICDGCKNKFLAKIIYIAPKPEFTPPVIYSRMERSKLVFLVEAKPNSSIAASLHPGQPVEVTLVSILDDGSSAMNMAVSKSIPPIPFQIEKDSPPNKQAKSAAKRGSNERITETRIGSNLVWTTN